LGCRLVEGQKGSQKKALYGREGAEQSRVKREGKGWPMTPHAASGLRKKKPEGKKKGQGLKRETKCLVAKFAEPGRGGGLPHLFG